MSDCLGRYVLRQWRFDAAKLRHFLAGHLQHHRIHQQPTGVSACGRLFAYRAGWSWPQSELFSCDGRFHRPCRPTGTSSLPDQRTRPLGDRHQSGPAVTAIMQPDGNRPQPRSGTTPEAVGYRDEPVGTHLLVQNDGDPACTTATPAVALEHLLSLVGPERREGYGSGPMGACSTMRRPGRTLRPPSSMTRLIFVPPGRRPTDSG